ncbi:MAG: hypothetical protein M3081_00485 [Gemmatimonadota bacterium]|nr:hypothetical protein [Gemmatimonadota bacterium]
MNRTLHRWLIVAAAACLATVSKVASAQEPTVVIRGPVRGRAATILSEALAKPHHIIVGNGQRVDLRRDTTYTTTVIVLGARTTVASTVNGDIIVVNGDLFLHPGAVIHGRAVAIGAGAYNSALAKVDGGGESFSDAAWEVSSTPTGIELLDVGMRAEPVALVVFPLAYGFRIPEYNRVDGLVIPFGPRVNLLGGRATIDPIVTYRSNLGEVDPSAAATLRLSRDWTIDGEGGRATFSNDRWIQSNLTNSISSFLRGIDYRNYYRANFATARLSHLWQTTGADVRAWVGGQTERSWSVAAGGPWSFAHRRDTVEGMTRPNPMVGSDRLSSALVGGSFDWQSQDVHATLRAELEVPFQSPGDGHFYPTVIEGRVGFPTFKDQRLDLFTHVLVTFGDTAPPVRFAYFGGQGTIPTLELLSRGGDQLFFFESDYTIPVAKWEVPFLGSPTFMIRHLIGGADVHRLGRFDQNIGLRAQLSFFRAEFFFDPSSHKSTGGLGLSLVR